MKNIDIINSKIDNTVKFVFESNGNILEFSYINKNDGKDIIVVPTQTSCKLGCKFCFLTGLDIPVRNLNAAEIIFGVSYVTEYLKNKNDVLLISYMGCGEPLLTLDYVIISMLAIRKIHNKNYHVVRFAVASLIPSKEKFLDFTRKITNSGILCKFHYSLHTIDSSLRKEIMPAAVDFEKNDIFKLLRDYSDRTNSSIEVHYSLIDGINDSNNDANELAKLLSGDVPIPIKFLKLSEKDGERYRQSGRVDEFRKILGSYGIFTEYYEPPGNDVGSSCGQFLLDYYKII